MGLRDGTPDAHILEQAGVLTATPQLWTNVRGKALLEHIRRDTGIFFDASTDCPIYPNYSDSTCGILSVH
jgi:hypothetical protein